MRRKGFRRVTPNESHTYSREKKKKGYSRGLRKINTIAVKTTNLLDTNMENNQEKLEYAYSPSTMPIMTK